LRRSVKGAEGKSQTRNIIEIISSPDMIHRLRSLQRRSPLPEKVMAISKTWRGTVLFCLYMLVSIVGLRIIPVLSLAQHQALDYLRKGNRRGEHLKFSALHGTPEGRE
jgi:hypothetical protein